MKLSRITVLRKYMYARMHAHTHTHITICCILPNDSTNMSQHCLPAIAFDIVADGLKIPPRIVESEHRSQPHVASCIKKETIPDPKNFDVQNFDKKFRKTKILSNKILFKKILTLKMFCDKNC